MTKLDLDFESLDQIFFNPALESKLVTKEYFGISYRTSWRKNQEDAIKASQEIAKRRKTLSIQEAAVPGLNSPVSDLIENLEMDKHLNLSDDSNHSESHLVDNEGEDLNDLYNTSVIMDIVSSESDEDLTRSPLTTSSEIDSPEEDEPEEDNQLLFAEKLGTWMAANSVTHIASNELLHLLRDEGLNLPLDRRTLLKTVRDVGVLKKCGGDYVYIGLQKGIAEEFRKGHFISQVKIDFGVDGIPIFKSRKSELWPILARFSSGDPFLVCCYYGRGKPNSPEEFLEDLLVELGNIIGIDLEYETSTYQVFVRCFICDAPARAFLKGIVHHTGYHSCERCTIVGVRESKRISFHEPEDVVERTDSRFRRFEYHSRGKCHQHEVSPLTRVSHFDLIGDVILDSMHMVYLGITRRILYTFKGKIKGLRRARLSVRHRNLINLRLASCNGKLPSEFNRQPRSLDDLDYWKASELRSFLLYTGIVALKGIVQDAVYDHFIHLSMAMTLLSTVDDERRNECLPYCRDLLQYFINNASKFYEGGFVVYNVHSVQHIPDDVERHNTPCHRIDAFPFENALKSLKRMIKGPQNPVSQVYRKNLENKRRPKKVRALKISNRPKDYCFETNEMVLLVKEIMGNKVICHAYQKSDLNNVFKSPKESREFGIYSIPRGTRNTAVEMSKKDMVHKCVNLPYKDGIAVIPMVDCDL